MAARLRLFIFALSVFASSPANASRVVISCGAVGQELELCRTGAMNWAKKTGNTVEVVAAPNSSSERLSQYQLLLAAKTPDIDVFVIDTTWPGILSPFFLDLNTNVTARSVAKNHFETFINNNTIQNKLIAMPWFIDAGLLYYRKDLLEKYSEKVPETWTSLTRVAKKIQDGERASGNKHFWGYVFEARAYEGLTCNALEWIASSGGGTIIDLQGKITVDNSAATQAISLGASWINQISPPGVLNYMEEEARGAFQSGNAAFLRNWPYVWKLVNETDSPLKNKVGVSTLPKGDSPQSKSVGTLGGWSLAVSNFSRYKDAAIDLVLYLSGSEEEKRRALVAGLNPTLTEIYKDPELIKANPQLPFLYQIFLHAIPRPSQITGSKYNRVSADFWDTVHNILSKETTPEKGLKDLKSKLEVISRDERWSK